MDLVYAGDLEKSVQYALTQEIPAQAILDDAKMKSIYQYLEVVIQYLPVREKVKKFLIALREWPIKMDYRTLTGEAFSKKVDELIQYYKPFEATPQGWIACRGSRSRYRGYPCSVWTSFHTMTVNAAIKGDPGIMSPNMDGSKE